MALSDVKLKFSLDSSGVTKTLNSTKASIKNFASSAVSSFGLVAGAAGLGALTSSAMSYASEMKELIKISGSSSEEFQRMAAAAKTVNIEQDKFADILKDTNDKIGDFLQTGAGPMRDFFEQIAPKVGATREEFVGLSGPQALQRYYDYLQRANLSQQDMTFYMEAIASDATALIPLLHDGGEAFRALGEGAAIMEDSTIEALDRANDRIELFKRSATINFGKVLSALFGDAATANEKEARKQLTAEGKLKKAKGLSTSFMTGRNAEVAQNKLIAERVKLIEAEAEEKKQADIRAQKLLVTEKVTADLAKKAAREKAAADRAAERALATANRKAETAARELAIAKKLAALEFDAADKNQSGYVTPREQRAAEREQRAADRDRRNQERDERAAEIGEGEKARQAEKGLRMTAREQAAGIDTSDRIGSMTPGAGPIGKGQNKTVEAELTKQTTVLEKIETELTT